MMIISSIVFNRCDYTFIPAIDLTISMEGIFNRWIRLSAQDTWKCQFQLEFNN